MGIGDELMMAGEAQRLAAGTARKYSMRNKRGESRWHFVWEGNPHVAKPGEDHDGHLGYEDGQRPYIQNATPTRYVFRPFTPTPAQLRMTPRMHELAKYVAGGIVFNPTIKYRASPNKEWGLERWKELVQSHQALRWIQIGEAGAMPRIRGAEQVPTNDFFEACGVLSGARAAVLHEGALHHAAAAFGKPAVVIRGGFISPAVTGYAGQVSLYVESIEWPLGCGSRLACLHCTEAMASITPAAVAAALWGLLK